MSLYEQIDYDSLLDRIGVPHNTLQPDGSTLVEREWFCGPNPEPNYSWDDAGITYDDVINYNGRSQHSPAGLCLTEDVNVNGLVLNRRDEDGTLWLCTGIEGWWTLPPSEIIDVPKPYWDGSMLTTGRYLSRTITISGCFIPPHASSVWRNRDRLIRSASIVRGVGLLATCGNQSPSNPERLPLVEVDTFHEYTYEARLPPPRDGELGAPATMAPPGAGMFRMSASSPASTETLWVHRQDLAGQDRTRTWMGLTVGSLVYAADVDEPATNALFELKQLPAFSSSGDHVILDVQHVESTGTMTGTCSIGLKAPKNPRSVPNPMYDPAKMAIIQTADVPLIETVRPNGFTQFSLSFRCAIPTKTSIKERNHIIHIPGADVEVGRSYESFSSNDFNWIPPDHPESEDTSYTELTVLPHDNAVKRKYSDVKFYNPDSPILDEEYLSTGVKQEDMQFYNGGNYFTFPVLVIEPITGIVTDPNPILNKRLEINNDTTDETLRLVKEVPLGHRLIVDSLARRVALVQDNYLDRADTWVWNARDYLSLDSEWISLAPGVNQFFLSKDLGVAAIGNAPRLFWRDSWIG